MNIRRAMITSPSLYFNVQCYNFGVIYTVLYIIQLEHKSVNKAGRKFSLFPNVYNAILFFILLILVIYYINLVKAAKTTTFDDAYMFIRYANNFLDGTAYPGIPTAFKLMG